MATQVANLVISTAKEVSKLEFQIISPGQRGNGGGVFHLQGYNETEVAGWVAKVGNDTTTTTTTTTTTASYYYYYQLLLLLLLLPATTTSYYYY